MEEGSQHTLEGQSTHPSLERTVASDERAGRSSAVVEQGTRVGRYLVLRELGRGGMGAVYAAYDQELDRKVALKLVRFQGDRAGEASRSRLLREAQAMARVTHPNVVTVHDVGMHRDQVYVAMEFIEGITVKTWCTAKRRSWAEVVDVFRQAGRGLAAAHEQGLVHRDFKPENVMVVAKSGRVVVLDFGLARGSDVAESRERGDPADSGTSMSALLSTEITRAGDLTGTPAYMSPEQFAHADVDASSDQFSFCVSFYEALYGERPFRGDSAAALLFAVTEGKVVAGDLRRGVPPWLRRIVLRGLAPDPASRWPSMNALLEALAPERSGRRRRVIAIAAVCVAGAAAIGVSSWLGSRSDVCGGAERHLDGVWDDARREQASARVQGLALPWFAHNWASTVMQLDEYAAQWASIHQDACEATTRRGEQSERVMDMRMACLSRARVELEATTDRLLTLDEQGALRVQELLAGLPPLARCSEIAALEADVEPPRDPETQAQVDAIREGIASTRAARRMGKADAVDALAAISEQVAAVDYAPVRAEYLWVLGDAQQFAGRAEEARATLDGGLRVALATRQSEIAIEILFVLAVIAGEDLQRPSEAMIYAGIAQGLAGAPGIGARSARVAHRTLAMTLEVSGQYDAALEARRSEMDAIPADRELELADAREAMARLLEVQGSSAEAEKVYREVIRAHGELLGETHPSVADDYSSLGVVLMQLRRYDEAEAAHRHALKLDSAAFAPGHPSIAGSHSNLGATLGAAGRHREAAAEFRTVLEIIGESHPRAPLVHVNLGTLALDQEHFVEAEREYRLALERYAGTLGVEHPQTIPVHSTLGAALDGQGRHTEAEVEHRKALAIALAAHGEDHDLVAKAHQRLGASLVAQGRYSEAVDLLERSLAHRLAHNGDPVTIAITRFSLAKALWETNRDRARAIELARAAAKPSNDADRKRAARVRTWLAAHGR